MPSAGLAFGFTLFAGLLGLGLSDGQCPNIEKHTDFPGGDIGNEYADSVDKCCDICGQDSKCKYFTYDDWAHKCYKKDSKSGHSHSSEKTSGSSPEGPGPSPPPPPPPPPPPSHDSCAKSYDNIVKAGNCSKPNKCPDASYIGKWSVYAVPCDDNDADELYKWDPGWGGAHITVTGFQAMSQDDAWQVYDQTQKALHPTQPYDWRPETFKAYERKDGLREIRIASKNLDTMTGIMKEAGWHDPMGKDWHVTLSDLTSEKLDGTQTYDDRKHLLASHHWALVLVQCVKDEDGHLAFHRQKGFQLVEWSTSAQGTRRRRTMRRRIWRRRRRRAKDAVIV